MNVRRTIEGGDAVKVSAHLGFRSAGPDEVAGKVLGEAQPFFVYVVEGELEFTLEIRERAQVGHHAAGELDAAGPDEHNFDHRFLSLAEGSKRAITRIFSGAVLHVRRTWLPSEKWSGMGQHVVTATPASRNPVKQFTVGLLVVMRSSISETSQM